MNDETERQIVDELRKLNAVVRKANKVSVAAVAILAGFVVLFLATIPLRYHLDSQKPSVTPETDSWSHARDLRREDRVQQAKEMLERLLRKYPDYYYGHALLGTVYQELGDLEAAEKSYARAADLFPDEDNVKTLAAIRKAVQRKNESANQAPQVIGTTNAPRAER